MSSTPSILATDQLFTERLMLRLVTLADLDAVHQLHCFPEVDQFNTLGIPKNITSTEKMLAVLVADNEHVELHRYSFVIEQKNSKTCLGMIAINASKPKYQSAEVWYKLSPQYWGNGYATEALQAILDFGFEQLQLHRIEAGCAVENKGSIRVLEKVGMTLEGRKRQTLPLKTGWSDNFEYGLLKSDRKK